MDAHFPRRRSPTFQPRTAFHLLAVAPHLRGIHAHHIRRRLLHMPHTFAQQHGPCLLLSVQGAAVNAWTDPPAAQAFASATNNLFYEEWTKFDPRFKLAVTLSFSF